MKSKHYSTTGILTKALYFMPLPNWAQCNTNTKYKYLAKWTMDNANAMLLPKLA